MRYHSLKIIKLFVNMQDVIDDPPSNRGESQASKPVGRIEHIGPILTNRLWAIAVHFLATVHFYEAFF